MSVSATLCLGCPFRGECGYRTQEARLARLTQEPAGLIVVAPREYWHLPLPGRISPDLVVFDEAPPNLGYKVESLSFDTLAEPLTYDGPRRRKKMMGRVAKAAETADALATLLAEVRPTLIAIRDAFQQEPATALRFLRERGVNEKRLYSVLASLGLHEDRVLGERVASQIEAFVFAAEDGRPFDLDTRLLDTIEGHEAKQIRALRHLLEALRLEIGRPYDEPVAVRRSENVGRGQKGVEVHLLGTAHFGPEVPFLHLDGTGSHDIAEQLFGPLRLEWHPVERPSVVTQVLGKTFSRQSITGRDAQGDPIPSRQDEAAKLCVALVALCHTQPEALVVATRGVIEALEQAGLRNPKAHFGALRGLNTWEHLNEIIIIGREQPSPAAVEGPGRALAARAGDLFTPNKLGAPWSVERRGLRIRSGEIVGIDVEFHPDPWADRVLQQIREAEVLQAIDRVRPHYKPEPVRVTLLCPLALDVTVDRVEWWSEARHGCSKVERAIAQHVLPLSVAEATRAFPHLWPNVKAAQRDGDLKRARDETQAGVWVGQSPNRDSYLDFVLGKQPALMVSYRRPAGDGRGGSRTTFRALVVAGVDEARAVLEGALGPMEAFRIEALNKEAEAQEDALQAKRLAAAKRKPLVEAPPSDNLQHAVPSRFLGHGVEKLRRVVRADTS